MRSLKGFALVAALICGSHSVLAEDAEGVSSKGRPEILSMSALTFGPENTLFIGDSKGGSIFAIQVVAASPAEGKEGINIAGIETKIAAMLGTTAEQVMIHDLAVHRPSQEIYLAVSRGRGSWDTRWHLPNDLADANILFLLHRMLEKMSYAPEESDMIIVHIEVEAEFGDRREKRFATLMKEGTPFGESAMSRAVGLPTAMATQLVLEGDVHGSGVQMPPTLPGFHKQVLEKLAPFGFEFERRTTTL